MKTTLAFLLMISVFIPRESSFTTTMAKAYPSQGDIVNVSFCDLVKNPKLYDSRLVRVQAIYRYGFEWSELYCLSCSNTGVVWAEFGEKFNSKTKKNIADKVKDKGSNGKTLNVIAVGVVHGMGGKYGHLGAYKNKLVIEYLEAAEVILNDSPSRSLLPQKALKRAICK